MCICLVSSLAFAGCLGFRESEVTCSHIAHWEDRSLKGFMSARYVLEHCTLSTYSEVCFRLSRATRQTPQAA